MKLSVNELRVNQIYFSEDILSMHKMHSPK